MEKSFSPFSTSIFAVVATLIAFLSYAPGFPGDYVFDDFPNILENQAIHIQSLDLDSLLTAALSSSAGLLKRPISMTSFALNYYFFGEGPLSLKITNLLIHILNSIGLYIFTASFLSIYRRKRELPFSATQLRWIAATIALLWLVHPINLTSVLYIVQRMNELSSFFIIYGLIFYVWYRNRLGHKQGNLFLLIGGCLLFFVLAVLSKENGALFPLYLLLTESILFKFRDAREKIISGIFAGFSILVVLPLCISIAWLAFNPDFILNGYVTREFTLHERVLTESRVVTEYLQLIFAPSLSQLGLYHDDWTLSRSLFDPDSTALSLVFLGLLLAFAVYASRKYPPIGYGILWFFLGHLLESTVYPFELMHEHRNYLASYGILLSISIAASFTLNRIGAIRVGPVIAALAITALALTTFFRASQWESNISLALSEAKHHPNSPRATYAAARILVQLVIIGEQAQLAEEAMQRLETAVATGKTDIKPDIARLIFAGNTDRPIRDEWLRSIEDKLDSSPITPSEINSLKKLIQCQRSACAIPDNKIIRLFEISLKNPYLISNSELTSNVLSVYADFALNNHGDYALTEKLFLQAIRISPQIAQYRINYIRFLIASKRVGEAKSELNALVELKSAGHNRHQIKELSQELLKTKAAAKKQNF